MTGCRGQQWRGRCRRGGGGRLQGGAAAVAGTGSRMAPRCMCPLYASGLASLACRGMVARERATGAAAGHTRCHGSRRAGSGWDCDSCPHAVCTCWRAPKQLRRPALATACTWPAVSVHCQGSFAPGAGTLPSVPALPPPTSCQLPPHPTCRVPSLPVRSLHPSLPQPHSDPLLQPPSDPPP